VIPTHRYEGAVPSMPAKNQQNKCLTQLEDLIHLESMVLLLKL